MTRIVSPPRGRRQRLMPTSDNWRARWSVLSAAVATALLCLDPGSARAYPDRNIMLIVPFAPGGPTDIIARILSPAFQKSLCQSVIVHNRGGVAGHISMSLAGRSAADQDTLLLSSAPVALLPQLCHEP